MCIRDRFDTLGALDAEGQRKGLQAVRNLLASFSVDRIGDAHFEGIVYARGSIRALNQIQVHGGLVAAGDGNSQVVLEKGSNITYVKDFFGRGEQAVVFGGSLGIRHWCIR